MSCTVTTWLHVLLLPQASTASHVRVINCGQEPLVTVPATLTVTLVPLHASEASRTGLSETVQITTLDQFCADEAVERIDLLKIDTEGHEMDVLQGAAQCLREDRIFAIQVEFGETFLPTRYHFCDLYDLLSPQYKIYRILRHGLYELSGYTHDLEIYKLTNYLCIHR